MAKRARWLVFLSSIFIGLPILAVTGFVTYRIIDNKIDEINLTNDINPQPLDLKQELNLAENKWRDQNFSYYEVEIKGVFGGHKMWEGFGGISTGGTSAETIEVQVKDGIPISITNKDSGEPFTREYYKYFTTIPQIFDLICNALEKGPTDFTEMTDKFWASNGKDPHYYWSPADSSSLPITISAKFDDWYGFPTTISIYQKKGSNDYYTVDYEVTYFILVTYKIK